MVAIWYLWPKSAQTTTRTAQSGTGQTLAPADMATKPAPAKAKKTVSIAWAGNDKLSALEKIAYNLMMNREMEGFMSFSRRVSSPQPK